MSRHANCPACKRRFRVEPPKRPGDGPYWATCTNSDVFPQHADITNGGWCEGSLWLVESEDYASEAP